MQKHELILILSAAQASEQGIVVETNDPERLRTRLYNVRKNQHEFAELTFVLSPRSPTTELWIVKRNA